MKDSEYADHLIGIYLDGINSISNDAGWEGDSMMSRLIDFHGQIPPGTGNDQSNLSMILAVEKLRGEHALFDKLKRIIGDMLGAYGESDKILALLSRHFYRGINPATSTAYTHRDRIKEIGYAPPTGDDSEKAWENAERYYKRRCKLAREILLERVNNSENTLKSA